MEAGGDEGQGLCWLPLLPYNVLYEICLNLNPKYLIAGLSPASSYFTQTILQHSDTLWRTICQGRWGDSRILQHHHTYHHRQREQQENIHVINHKRRRTTLSIKSSNDEVSAGVDKISFWMKVFKNEVLADRNWKGGHLVSKRMINGGQRKAFARAKELARWARKPLWGWGVGYSHLQSFDVSPHYIATFACSKSSSNKRKVVVFSSSSSSSLSASSTKERFKKVCTFHPFMTLNEGSVVGDFVQLSIISSTPSEAILLILDGMDASLWRLQGLNEEGKKPTVVAVDGLPDTPSFHMAIEKSDEPTVVFACSYGLIATRLRNRTRFEILWQKRSREAECIAMNNQGALSVYQRSDGLFLGDMTIRADHSIRRIAVWQDRLALLTCNEATGLGEREVVLMVIDDVNAAVALMKEVEGVDPLPVEAWPWKIAQMTSKVAEMGFGLDVDANRIVVSMEDLKIWAYEKGGELQQIKSTATAVPDGEEQMGQDTEPQQPQQQQPTQQEETRVVEVTRLYKTIERKRPPLKAHHLERKPKMITGCMMEVRLWGDRVFTVDNRGIVEAWHFL